jgi:hypothetical protein
MAYDLNAHKGRAIDNSASFRSASEPWVAFCAAIALVQRFDPEITPACEADGLAIRLTRLENALADAIEAANHTRETIREALDESNLQMPAPHLDAIARYIELAESGTTALLDTGADPARCCAALQVITSYQLIADTVASIPRMRGMRQYLAATGLRASPDTDGSGESVTAALENECELLTVVLGPRVLTNAPRNLDVVEARFQKFKWTYVHCYLSAHEEWREKMEHLALILNDATRYSDSLVHLNQIVLLGPPEGEELAARVAELATSIVRCELPGSVAPETTPRCSSCGFILGAIGPSAELDDVMERLRRGLSIKLAALSQRIIERLIREHDRDDRLEGFLKITQASQTDALVRVLDEKFACYLAQVLDDNLVRPVGRSAVVRKSTGDFPNLSTGNRWQEVKHRTQRSHRRRSNER